MSNSKLNQEACIIMPRLVFHLSGRFPDSLILGEDDCVFHSRILDDSRVHKKSIALPDADNGFERELCEKYIQLFFDEVGASELPTNFDHCFLNDYYSYSVRPIFTQMLAVKELCDRFPEKDVLVLSAKTNCSLVPMLGFKTTESKRGSQDLLGSVTAEQMKGNKAFESAEFISLRGDIFCNDVFRKRILLLANFVFSLLFIAKCALISSRRGNRVDGKPLVIYRNSHQERFALKLVDSGNDLSLLYIPQLTQGVLRPKKTNDIANGEINTLGFDLSDVLFSIRKSRVLAKPFQKISKNESADSFVHVKGVSVKLNKGWIKSELGLISIVFIYSALLSRILQKHKVKRLVNFELVGRMAGIEAMAARNLGVETVSIQTALVASRPHPVFPYSNKFFADSEVTAKMIRNNGVVAAGAVEFAGSLDRTRPLKSAKRFSQVVFYTQPYEPDVTMRILSALTEWANRNKVELKIKLHPRDYASAYSTLGLEAFYVDKDTKIAELYEWADLTVTRTSSVAKESLSLGCPVLLTMWSISEQTLKADYINSMFSEGYISNDIESLKALLSDPFRVVNSNLRLHRALFSNLGPDDLLNAILKK